MREYSLERCKCCNAQLFYTELNRKIVIATEDDLEPNIILDIEDDLCNVCRDASRQEFDYIEDKEYAHSQIEEGITLPKHLNINN